jgi:hypothetical protein
MVGMNEEGAIRARISGQAIEKIAKARRVSVAEVHQVFDRFCDRTLNPDARRHGLAFELARLDRLLEACWPKAVAAIWRRSPSPRSSSLAGVMLGLHAPTTAILKIIDESVPRVTSTQQLEATLDALTEDGPADGQAPN